MAALGVDVADLRRAGLAGTLTVALLRPGRTQIRLVQSRLHRADGVTEDLGDTVAVTLSRADPEISIELSPSPQRGDHVRTGLDAGDRLSVELHVSHGGQITGWSARLRFDPAALRYVDDSVVFGDLLVGLSGLIDVDEGVVSVGGAVLGASRGVPGDGLLARLELEVLQRFAGSRELTLEEPRLRRPDGAMYEVEVSRGAQLWTEAPPTIVLDVDPAAGDQGARRLPDVEAGQRVQVQLHAVDVPAIRGWSARCAFEPRQLTYVVGSFAPGPALSGLVPLVDAGEGYVEVGGAVFGDAGQGFHGAGELGAIAFGVTERFGAEAVVTVVEARLFGLDGTVTRLTPWSTVELTSGDAVTAVGEGAATPTVTMLAGSYPNPFNATAVIRYQLARAGPAWIRVYDVTGRRVVTLVEGRREVGYYETRWDGRDEAGRPVASGVYTVALDGAETRDVHRMLLLR